MTDDRPAWQVTIARTDRLPSATSYVARGPRWILLTEGVARLEAGGEVRSVWAGDAVLVGPRESFALTSCADTAIVELDLAMTRPTHPLPGVLVVPDFAQRHDGIAAMVRTCPLMTRCGPPLMTASYANLIGSAMTESWLESTGGRAEADTADPLVATVVQAVSERPGDDWTVDRMAGLVHLSRSALGERFRRELRLGPAEVLREARMREARRLLHGGDRPVEQVAHAVGYGSTAAFSRAFAARHGVPPQQWRATSGAGAHAREQGPAERRDGRAQAERRHDSVRVDEQAS